MSAGDDMAISSALLKCRGLLLDAEIPYQDAVIESRMLLEYATGLTAEQVIGNPDRLVDDVDIRDYFQLVSRRIEREPIDYIFGETEFYGRSFRVNTCVMSPRPETEMLVVLALEFASDNGLVNPRICDLGTGSGALAVTLAVELDQCEVIACDISDDALAVAQSNAERYDVARHIDFRDADMTSESVGNALGRFDIVVANPPYIPTSRLANELEPEVSQWEPRLALDGGPDGMGVLGPLIERLPRLMRESGPSLALIEIDSESADECLARATRALPNAEIEIVRDAAGLHRILAIEHPA